MKKIALFGTGYVGLTTAACLAEMGYSVVGYDVNEAKIDQLRQGQIPFSEPELAPLVERNISAGRLAFTADCGDALNDAEMVFICVGTPTSPSGAADLSQVEAAVRLIARSATRSLIVVLKSTIPPGGSAEHFAEILTGELLPPLVAHIVVNPEFLREGSAVHDFFFPDRVVVGAWDRPAGEQVAALYSPLHCPVLLTDPATAQLTKYASNAFLAAKISFINEVGRIAEKVGANVYAVAQGMGLDERIGGDFLEAGLGYGGSCFPKDVKALAAIAERHGSPSALLRAVMEVNAGQRRLAAEKLHDALGGLGGKNVCVLGLAFKPDTDDVREAPALDVISMLCDRGATVRTYDPVAASRAQEVLPPHSRLHYCEDAYEAAKGSDAVFIATDWKQFRDLDWNRMGSLMKGKTILDSRGLISPLQMQEMGFRCLALSS